MVSSLAFCQAPAIIPHEWPLPFRCCFLLLLTCKGDSSELYMRICIITSITLVGMSCQKLDIPCSQLPHTYFWMARKHTVPSRLNWKCTSHIGKAVSFLCPAHCCCCTLLVLDTKSSQLYFHLGINHIVCGFFSCCLGGEWGFCRQALGLFWRRKRCSL